MINIVKIQSEAQQEEAFIIRRKVFVEEQGVSSTDEYDEYEDESTHFLAYYEQKPCGTARWRITDKGIKLERFAVIKEMRGKAIGSSLVAAVLADIDTRGEVSDKTLYLHAQLGAVPLYAKHGFETEGEQFDECGIMHYKMKKERTK